MRKHFILGAAILLSSTAIASAADLYAKAAPPAPAAAAPSWTGFYVGVNAGWAANADGYASGAQTNYANTSGDTGTETHGPGGPAWLTKESLNGFVGGGQLGYNYQVESVVLGAEADIQGGSLKGSASASSTTAINLLPFPPGGPNLWPVTGNMAATSQVDWFGTVRARLGFVTMGGDALVYGTGGLAYGQVSSTLAYSGGFAAVPSLGFGGSVWNVAGTSSAFKTGWTAGAGFEYSLRSLGLSHWTIRAEYLMVDLGSIETDVTGPAFRVSNGSGGRAVSTGNSMDAKLNVARVGVDYRF